MNYRRDVDGLRALAIIAVVAYHASPISVPGGFVGVDIFFVISGFLISGIIFRQLEAGSFSFTDFYSRRIRRIFPALILVLVSVFIAGWLILLADEFRQLGQHTAAGAGFVQNILLWRESGYFDTASELKPLMHLWSLAIEEQYYLLYPLFMMVLWRSGLNVMTAVGLLALGSFALNISHVHSDPVATFFSPQTRIWELLAGGLLAYSQSRTTSMNSAWLLPYVFHPVIFYRPPPVTQQVLLLNNGFAILGVLLIAATLYGVNSRFSFPGWWALLPVMGAMLLIQAGSEAWINRRVLSHRWLVGIGLISYPLYLWHWPLLAFARIMESGLPSREIRIAAVIVSVVLAWLTYQWLEKPLRSTALSRIKTLVLVSLMGAVGVMGYVTYLADGFPERDNERNQFDLYFGNYIKTHPVDKLFRMECGFWDWVTDGTRTDIAKECYTPHSEKSVFLWGDSHAQHLNYGLRKNLPTSISLLQIATSWCAANLVDINKIYDKSDRCNLSNKFALQKIKEAKPQVVIIAQLDDHDVQDFDKIVRQLKKFGVKDIIVVGPVPRWIPYLYKIILRKYSLSTPRRIKSNLIPRVFEIDAIMKQRYSNSTELKYISIVDYLCNAEGCVTYFGDDFIKGITTLDYGHLTAIASDSVAKDLLVPQINNYLHTQSTPKNPGIKNHGD